MPAIPKKTTKEDGENKGKDEVNGAVNGNNGTEPVPILTDSGHGAFSLKLLILVASFDCIQFLLNSC